MGRKLKYLGVAIVVPELLACMAGGQWAAARRSIGAMGAIGNSDWTMIHGFDAEMGGFVLEGPALPFIPSDDGPNLLSREKSIFGDARYHV